MTYNKPEVTVLGSAANELQTASKPGTLGGDNPGSYDFVPAYDLDE